MKTPEQIFSELWDVEHPIMQGFLVKIKLKGKELTLKITDCGLYYDEDSNELSFYDDEFATEPVCDLSKWLDKIIGLEELLLDSEWKAPKEIKQKITALGKSLKGADPVLIQLYFDTANHCKDKASNLQIYLNKVVKYNKDLEEKARLKTFKLNDRYNATFAEGEDWVQVGCQKIHKSTIKELASQL